MRGIVDRIEEGFAVIETAEESYVSALPGTFSGDVAEGSVVDYELNAEGHAVQVQVNAAATRARRERMAALRKRMLTR